MSESVKTNIIIIGLLLDRICTPIDVVCPKRFKQKFYHGYRYICADTVTIGDVMREVAGYEDWSRPLAGGRLDDGVSFQVFTLEIDIIPDGAQFVGNELYSIDVVSSMKEAIETCC